VPGIDTPFGVKPILHSAVVSSNEGEISFSSRFLHYPAHFPIDYFNPLFYGVLILDMTEHVYIGEVCKNKIRGPLL